MKETSHDKLIASLAELRQALPSMRLGQLIANMATVARGAVAGAVWEMEDDELLEAIRWQLQQLSACAAVTAADPGVPERGGTASSPVSTAAPPPRQVG